MGSLIELTTDGTFPSPLKFYSDAILYDVGVGNGGTVTGDGVFVVAQFSNYPYDPFTTLRVTDDWLEVGAERNTSNDTWTVSFRTKNDDLYDITSGVVKLADFVGGNDYPLNSTVVNGLTDIKWGFYDTNLLTTSVPNANVGDLSVDLASEARFTDSSNEEYKGRYALDLKGNYCVVAEATNSDSFVRQVHIYKNVSGVWSSKKVINFSDSGLSSSESSFKGWASNTLFNSTQDMLFVTARQFDHGGVTDSGCVIVFKTTDGWTTFNTHLIISRPNSSLANTYFGTGICLSSDDKVLIVGCFNDGKGSYAFYTTDNWSSATSAGKLRAYKEEFPASSGSYGGSDKKMAISSNGSGGYFLVIGERYWNNNTYYSEGLVQNNGIVEFWKSTDGTSWSRCATSNIEGQESGGPTSDSYDDNGMRFGSSVAISGEYIFIGAPGSGLNEPPLFPSFGIEQTDNQGSVFVYKTTDYDNISMYIYNGSIKKITKAVGDDANIGFGTSLSVYGDNLVVGTFGSNSSYVESYYIYSRHAGANDSWNAVDSSVPHRIQPSDLTPNDDFGFLCVINESYIAVTAPFSSTNGAADGALYIYEYSGSIPADSPVSYYNAYYYKPTGNDNYITDNTSTSSSAIVTVVPSVSATYTGYDTTLHTSLYNPDTITAADGERVTKLTDLDIGLNSYGSIISFFTEHPTINGIYFGNDSSYDGFDSGTKVIPYNDGTNTVNYVKSITITSQSFDSNITYFTNPDSGWYYYQTVGAVTGYVTLHFDAIDNVAETPGDVDSLKIAEFNITGTDLTDFIDQLITIASNDTKPATVNIYYTNVSATSSVDTYFDRYKASQTGYDGTFQFRVKENSSTYSTNSKNYLVNARGAFYDTGNSVYVTRGPDNPSNIDVTEFFGRNIELYTRIEGKLYVVNAKRYGDSTKDIFPYDPYNGSYDQLWTGLKRYSMTSSLFSIATTYFTDVQPGWTYTQTDNGNGTVTLSFQYTADTTNGYTIANGTSYIAKCAINIDILSYMIRRPYSTTEPYISYAYEYHGSEGTINQSGYDAFMGTSVHNTTTDPEVTLDTYAIDSDNNTIDEQGDIIAYAEGDPHVRPINGSPYDLPHEETTFLLYSNNDTEYPVTIKSKCWYLPEHKYMKKIDRLNAVGYHERADRYLELFKENTYFKYLEFVCGPEHVIIDMDRLRPCMFTSMEDLENHVLPLADGYYENNKYINLTGFRHSKTGIVISKKPMKTTLDRVITLRGKDSIVTLRMIWDVRDIITRNGIEIRVRGLKHSDSGSLVRECVIYSQFGLNYEIYGMCVQLPIKRTSKVYSATSYGATEDKKSSLSEKTSFNQSNKIIQNVF